MAAAEPNAVLSVIDTLLSTSPRIPWDDILARILAHVDCPVGTLHVLEADQLVLRTQRGLPAPMLEKVARIPLGKGMAGIAAERREPVQVCNLQDDASGVVRPGAKLSRMEGSIACPMLDGKRLAGVLGVAKPVPHEFNAKETAFLMEAGRRIARNLAPVEPR